MSIILTIGGVDKTSLLLAGGLRISDELNSRNTCEFTLLDPAGAYRPAVGQEVILTDGVSRLFAGTVDEIEEAIPPGTTALEVQAVCVDYNQLADRHLVARVYENQTLGAIVRDIVTQDLVGEGITTSHVQDGPVITKATFNYQSVAEAFNDLAGLTGYAWNIDYNKDLHFFARETYLAPFELSDTSANFRSMVVRLTREQYRNRQYIRAGQDITDPRTEQFPGDGTTKTFVLAFPVAKVPTVKVNGVAKTIGIRGLDTGKDWYWSKGEKEITQDDAATALTSADTLAVTYQGLFPIILASQADAEISSRSQTEGGTGVYEAIEDDQSIDSQVLATQKADGLLRRFGRIPRIVEFETDIGGLAAGQLLTINVNAHNLGGQFLVDSVQAQDVEGQFLRYRVRALDGERLGGWVEFFQRLAQAGRKFVIRENEVLVLLRRFADALVLGDQLTVETKAAGGAKVTQFPYFSRPSVAYLSDGTQVAANVPRFEPGKFGQAYLGEEGTANIVPSWPAGWGVNYAPAGSNLIATDVGVQSGAAGSTVRLTNSGTNEGGYGSGGMTLSPSTTYTIRMKVRGTVGPGKFDVHVLSSTGTLIQLDGNNFPGPAWAPTTDWQVIEKTFTTTADITGANQYIRLDHDGNDAGYIEIAEIQLEQKNYAMSFAGYGTARSPESLIIPTDGVVSPNEGTVEFWINPDSQYENTYLGIGGTPWVIADEDNKSFQIYRLTGGKLYLRWGSGTGTYQISVADQPPVQQWTHVAVTWKANDKLKLFINGAPAGLLAIGALTSVFYVNQIYVGINRFGNYGAQARFDDLRISSRARTDAEIAAAYQSNAPLPVDEYTTLKLPFDGNLYFRPASEVGFAEVA